MGYDVESLDFFRTPVEVLSLHLDIPETISNLPFPNLAILFLLASTHGCVAEN